MTDTFSPCLQTEIVNGITNILLINCRRHSVHNLIIHVVPMSISNTFMFFSPPFVPIGDATCMLLHNFNQGLSLGLSYWDSPWGYFIPVGILVTLTTINGNFYKYTHCFDILLAGVFDSCYVDIIVLSYIISVHLVVLNMHNICKHCWCMPKNKVVVL